MSNVPTTEQIEKMTELKASLREAMRSAHGMPLNLAVSVICELMASTIVSATKADDEHRDLVASIKQCVLLNIKMMTAAPSRRPN